MTGVGVSGVSVIMIARNGAAFITDALNSIFLSRLRPLEVLVIDGGSTDGTAALAAAVPGVTVLAQVSCGISAAYNEGIAWARGDLLAFLSSDDLWLPGKLDRQAALMQADPGLLYSVTMVEHFLEPGCAPPPGFRRTLLDRPVPGMLMETLMARPAAFARIGGFDPAHAVAGDTDWFARARDAGLKMALLPEVLLRKRVHGGNASLTDPQVNGQLLTALRGSLARKRAAAG
jgi:glycosyltransferase involved in cell wall biosynthesis